MPLGASDRVRPGSRYSEPDAKVASVGPKSMEIKVFRPLPFEIVTARGAGVTRTG
jgi:hypothetical protein